MLGNRCVPSGSDSAEVLLDSAPQGSGSLSDISRAALIAGDAIKSVAVLAGDAMKEAEDASWPRDGPRVGGVVACRATALDETGAPMFHRLAGKLERPAFGVPD